MGYPITEPTHQRIVRQHLPTFAEVLEDVDLEEDRNGDPLPLDKAAFYMARGVILQTVH